MHTSHLEYANNSYPSKENESEAKKEKDNNKEQSAGKSESSTKGKCLQGQDGAAVN